MNARQSDTDPINDIDQLIDVLARGCKPRGQWRIGTEHEKFGFVRPDSEVGDQRLPFSTPEYTSHGIEDLLTSIRDTYPTQWKSTLDKGKIIGLSGQGHQKGASISLEPAGQFELSGAAVPDLHHTYRELTYHLESIRPLARRLGLGFFSVGFHPTASRQSQPWMPKSRYKIMREYMPKVGTLGHDMMKRTCTVQVNLDFSSEEDMVRKMQLSTALQPLATALFANSPFYEGKPGHYQSQRAHCWTDTDNDRCGIPACFFQAHFGFKEYVQWALDVPMYFIMRHGEMRNVAGRSFRQWIKGIPQEGLQDTRPTIADFNDHIATLFPDVRLKQFIEMRGADAGSKEMTVALPAFWVGLLYDPQAFEEAWSVVTQYPWSDYTALAKIVPQKGLNTPWQGKSLHSLAQSMIDIAFRGLRNRAAIDPHTGHDETIYLAPLLSLPYGGATQAQHWLERYQTVWQGDITRLFFESEI